MNTHIQTPNWHRFADIGTPPIIAARLMGCDVKTARIRLAQARVEISNPLDRRVHHCDLRRIAAKENGATAYDVELGSPAREGKRGRVRSMADDPSMVRYDRRLGLVELVTVADAQGAPL